MPRTINSPSAFKTCYIAQVKEELGYKVRRAHNRRTKARKHKVPAHLRPFIEEAFRYFERLSVKPTYRMIQEKAFELYREHVDGIHREPEVMKYFGIFNNDWDIVREVVEDDGLEYEG